MTKTNCKYTLREYDRAFRVLEDYIKNFNLYDDENPDFAVARIIEKPNGNRYLVFEEASPENDFGKWNAGV